MKQSLTITDIGVIVSLVFSTGTALFTAGIVYGDVQRNKERISSMEPKVEAISMRMERIDANVGFLAEREKERVIRR